MASLQISRAPLSPRPLFRSPSHPLIPKLPTHLPTKPRSSRHFRVLCNKKGGETSQGKVDRRNMLLGLGGLYGAATLVGNQSAYADPVKTKKEAKPAASLLPITLDKIVRVIVPKTAKGNVDERLVLEDIHVDATKLIKFDLFINDEDEEFGKLNRAEYLGTYQQLPQRTTKKDAKRNISFSLKELYKDIDVSDDDSIVVTIVPKENGDSVTIGNIKIIPLGST